MNIIKKRCAIIGAVTSQECMLCHVAKHQTHAGRPDCVQKNITNITEPKPEISSEIFKEEW